MLPYRQKEVTRKSNERMPHKEKDYYSGNLEDALQVWEGLGESLDTARLGKELRKKIINILRDILGC
jgi:hypothetical protein